MLTTDKLLLELFDRRLLLDNEHITTHDKKILVSLSQQLRKQHFFTEKQGILLVKLLEQNKQYFNILSDSDLDLIKNPKWSQAFRIIEIVRKIYFGDEKFSNIHIEFTFDKTLRAKLSTLSNNNKKQFKSISPTRFSMTVTEKNIVDLIDLIADDEFKIDEKILDLYRNIKKTIADNENYLDILNEKNQKILKIVLDDINSDSENDLLLLDRRHRFQYQYSPKKIENSLSFSIANRATTQLWVNAETYSLLNLINSLEELNRFPLLLVFDKNDVKGSLEILKKLNSAILEKGISDVGIYYRVDNDSEENKSFNNFIQENNLNYKLEDSTKIAGMASTFLPKFFYRTNWYPKSVIAFTNNFKSNKGFTYCDAVDLIIYYNNHRPLSGKINDIL
jgi:hypothetical protein